MSFYINQRCTLSMPMGGGRLLSLWNCCLQLFWEPLIQTTSALDTALPWVLINTPAKCVVSRMNSSRRQSKDGHTYIAYRPFLCLCVLGTKQYWMYRAVCSSMVKWQHAVLHWQLARVCYKVCVCVCVCVCGRQLKSLSMLSGAI